MPRKMKPIHPGEILKKELLKPLKISQYRLAKDIGVSAIRISEIVRGKRAISVDTAFRLGKYFRMSSQFWLNAQSRYDLEVEVDELEECLGYKIKPLSLKALKICDAPKK